MALMVLSTRAKLTSPGEEYSENYFGDRTVSDISATYLQFFRDDFGFFKCDFEEWTICMISDNCSLNHEISKEWKRPLVAYRNQKLNIQFYEMVKETPELEQQISSLPETMSSSKVSMKNAPILRNLTSLQPITPNVEVDRERRTCLTVWFVFANSSRRQASVSVEVYQWSAAHSF